MRTAVAVTPSRWWRHRPFLPLPTAGYLRLRALTQYGDAAAVPTDDDVARYLVWCREMRRHGSSERASLRASEPSGTVLGSLVHLRRVDRGALRDGAPVIGFRSERVVASPARSTPST